MMSSDSYVWVITMEEFSSSIPKGSGSRTSARVNFVGHEGDNSPLESLKQRCYLNGLCRGQSGPHRAVTYRREQTINARHLPELNILDYDHDF